MKLLHLTDFHFDKKKYNVLEMSKPALLKVLAKEKIDFVVFSGDLVTKPTSLSDFKAAKEYLLDPILHVLGLDTSSLIICEGNHDVQRGMELPMITDAFKKMKHGDEIDSFILVQNGSQLEASVQNHKLYFEFVKTILSYPESDTVTELYAIHKRTINNQKVTFCTINSAWRSENSEVDSGNLLYPIRKLEELVANIDKSNICIFVMHHPLRDFKEFVAREMEDLIYDNFHVMLTGHLHKKNNSVHFANDVGIFCSASQATFNKKMEGIELGFSILDFESEYFEVKLTNYFFNEHDKQFYAKDDISCDLPLSTEKEEQNKLRKTFRKRYLETRSLADGLFILPEGTISSFDDLFVDPVLVDKPKSQLKEVFETKKLSEIALSGENYLIFGRDKSGRTSLLYKIYLDLLSSFTESKVIPLFIDYKAFRGIGGQVDFLSKLTSFCETSKSKMGKLCQTYRIKILVDNYCSDNIYFNESLLSLMTNCPNLSIVATLEETISASYRDHKLNNHVFKSIFIHDITRSEIRALATKWPNLTEEKREQAIEKISRIFNQLNIPYNYWTVSLFLWITNSTNEENFHNNFELIQLYVDGILGRRQHTFDKSIKIDYEDLKDYLSFLAYKLVKYHQKSEYSITFEVLVNITSEFRGGNTKIVIGTDDLIKLVLDRGVVKKTESEKYRFRLNGVFEYFIAHYMKDNRGFVLELIKEDSLYLAFGNEFEYYSGFMRKDKDFVEKIFEKTKKLFEGTFAKYESEGDVDLNLSRRIQNIDILTRELTVSTNKDKFVLDHKAQDIILGPIEQNASNSEVKAKQAIERIEEKSEHLEKVLFILCRVFRNSNSNDPELDKKLLDYIIDSSCNLGFLLVDETREEALVDGSVSDKERSLIKIIMDMLPIIVQTFLFDALAQNNLERLLREKLDNLRNSPKNNQFRLFLVYYLLIDLDFQSNKSLIPQLIEDIKLGVLRHSNVLKLHLYLAFRATGKKELAMELEGYIRQQETTIDSRKVHAEDVHKRIEGTKKIGLVKRRKK